MGPSVDICKLWRVLNMEGGCAKEFQVSKRPHKESKILLSSLPNATTTSISVKQVFKKIWKFSNLKRMARSAWTLTPCPWTLSLIHSHSLSPINSFPFFLSISYISYSHIIRGQRKNWFVKEEEEGWRGRFSTCNLRRKGVSCLFLLIYIMGEQF